MGKEDFSLRERLDSASQTLDRVQSFVPRVDGRAQILLGIDLAMAYLLAVNAPAFSGPWWVDLSYVSAFVLIGASMYKLYRSLFPQLRGVPGSLVYFGEIKKLGESEYVDRFSGQMPRRHLHDLLMQVWRNSRIVATKFECLKDAMLATLIALPFWLVTLGFTAFVRGSVTLK